MHAFITIWPSVAEFRLEDGKGGSEPLTKDRVTALGRLLDTLLTANVDSIEIRQENADD